MLIALFILVDITNISALFVPLSTMRKRSQIKLFFKDRFLLYKQTGGKRDYSCQDRVITDEGCSTNEPPPRATAPALKYPSEGSHGARQKWPTLLPYPPRGYVNKQHCMLPSVFRSLLPAHAMLRESDLSGKSWLIKHGSGEKLLLFADSSGT